MIELSDSDIDDFIAGATILGTGGGGSPKEGKELLSRLHSRHLRISNVKELPSDAIAVSPYVVGSIAERISSIRKLSETLRKGVSLIENRLGQRIGATVPTEIGALNSAIALYVAAMLDVPMVDGDYVGRAAPEVSHSIAFLKGSSLTPGAAGTSTGLTVMVEGYRKVEEYELLLRQLSLKPGFVVVVDSSHPINILKKIIVKGTMSLCLRVGRVRREALRRREDVARLISLELKGYVIFSGTVKTVDLTDKGGFLKGTVTVASDYDRSVFKSLIMNEHIFGWIDDYPVVMPPDPFTFIDENGTGLCNTDVTKGQKVTVIAWRSASEWRTQKGIKLFGPRHFGLQYDYVPVETLITKLRKMAR